MSAGSFEKTSVSWSLQQLQQQVGEWIELKFSHIRLNFPEMDRPDWSFDSPWLSLLLRFIFWVMVLGFATWLSWKLYPLLRRYYQQLQVQWEERKTQPPPAARPMTLEDWLRRVQRQQAQGNYREASRALYMAMLQKLNDTQVVMHQSGRTDGEYWQLLRDLPRAQAYQVLLQTHEQLCFSEDTVSSERFERCQQAYREVDRP